ncbi:hypothetical protein KC337_g107 [Hortaea werneckii]|nr:hypothetical protein KC337_g107 [Hortaea werneckii]
MVGSKTWKQISTPLLAILKKEGWSEMSMIRLLSISKLGTPARSQQEPKTATESTRHPALKVRRHRRRKIVCLLLPV